MTDHGNEGEIMFELLGVWILSNLPTILALGTVVVGGVYGSMKLFNKKVSDAYNKGKSEEACLVRIENKADDAIEGLEEVKESLSKETEKAEEAHVRIYNKLDTQDNKISDIQTNVSYIKGLLEPKN